MYELKKIGKVFTSKFVGTGPSSYKNRIYPAAVSQRLRNTALKYAVSVQVNKDGLKLMVHIGFALFYAYDYILGGIVHNTIKRKRRRFSSCL
jgi:hypothetical protein